MPVARVQLADGRVARFEVPEGTTAQQVEQFAATLPQQQGQDPTGTTLQNVAAGAGKAVADLGRGAGQIARSVLPEKAADAIGLPTQADIDEARRRDAPLMGTGAGKIGNFAGNVAVAAPTIFAPGAGTYAGSSAIGALMGMLQPTSGGESRALNTAVGGGAGALGKGVADRLSSWVGRSLASRQAAGTASEAANAGKDATLAASREAGYVVPPTQANPGSAWNRLIESLSGKTQTAQHASARNQEVTNRLAKQAIGLPEDIPLSRETLKMVRDQAGQAYEAIANSGSFVTDATFKKQVAALARSQETLAQEVPQLANKDVLSLAQSLDRDSFDGRTLIDMTKALRDRATGAFKDGQTEAGRFYKGVAREVEDLIERNLLYTGNGGRQAVEAFQDARKLIAKSYSVEGALNDATGNVNAAELAVQLKRGKPLTDELKTAGRFAQAFPKAAATLERQGSTLSNSPLDWAMAGGLSAALGGTSGIASLAARPAARRLLLSDFYQDRMTAPSYGPGAAMRTLGNWVGNDYARRLAPAAASSAALEKLAP